MGLVKNYINDASIHLLAETNWNSLFQINFWYKQFSIDNRLEMTNFGVLALAKIPVHKVCFNDQIKATLPRIMK